MKTIDVVKVFNLLNSAKLTKMPDTEKYSVIKAMRVFKGINTSYTEAVKDAQEKLKPENFEELQERVRNWDNLTEEEKIATNTILIAYNKSVEDCLKDEAEKVHTFEFKKLSEEGFTSFIASNDFTIEEIMLLEDTLV